MAGSQAVVVPDASSKHSDEQKTSITAVIYYVDPDCIEEGLRNKFVGGKERMNIPINLQKHRLLPSFQKHVYDYGNLGEEGRKRGLGDNTELKLYRLDKSTSTTNAFAIPTQEAFEVELEHLLKGDTLQVNVLKRVVSFQKGTPVIRVTIAGADSSTGNMKKKPGSGRKPERTTIEDRELVKKLKTGEEVTRTERQKQVLEEMRRGIVDLGGSIVINEFSVQCGRCHKTKKVPTDRQPLMRVKYFREKHYDTACIQKCASTAAEAKREEDKKKMSTFLKGWMQKKPAQETEDEKDSDREMDVGSEDSDRDNDLDIK